MAEPRRHTIVCLSSQRWDDKMWTNKQHIMSRLAQHHRVLYVGFGGPPLVKFVGKKLKESAANLLAPRDLLLAPRVTYDHGVELIEVWTPYPVYALRYDRMLRERGQFDLAVWLVKRHLKKEGITDPIIWVYHPGFGEVVETLPHKLIAYDCVDEYTAFPEFRPVRPWIAGRERRLIEAADVVFCTASALYESKKKLGPGKTFLVHNVGDADHFAAALDPSTEVPADIRDLPKPVVGFIGAVSDYKLNVDWLLALARARPSWTIVVIGPTGIADPDTDVSMLQSEPNVKLLGHRPYARLPAYLKGFDIATIPYRINDYTRSVFPIKFFEFMATGRPVVVSNLPALTEFYDSVYVAKNASEFIDECDRALVEPAAARERRIALAHQNSWPERIRQLMGHIDDRLERGAAPRTQP